MSSGLLLCFLQRIATMQADALIQAQIEIDAAEQSWSVKLDKVLASAETDRDAATEAAAQVLPPNIG